MPLITEKECIEYGGKVEEKRGSPTWHGKQLKGRGLKARSIRDKLMYVSKRVPIPVVEIARSLCPLY